MFSALKALLDLLVDDLMRIVGGDHDIDTADMIFGIVGEMEVAAQIYRYHPGDACIGSADVGPDRLVELLEQEAVHRYLMLTAVADDGSRFGFAEAMPCDGF